MPIRYLIGIDFGHGETTASYIDMEKPADPESLHIRDGQNADQDKVESCICRDKATGEWRFVNGIEDYSSPDLRIGFKQPMNEITPENKEAFGAFIRLVFSRILKFQNFLRYNPKSGERNFELCVACPSGWNDETNRQIHEYLAFMRSLIPVSWVIKESDAAYFKFRNKEFAGSSVLVIDVGSSTIDFTYYDTETGRAHDPIGYPHGASRVERSILAYLDENDETYQEGKERILTALETNQGGNRNWLHAARHFVKGEKEDFYTTELNALNLVAPIRRFVGGATRGFLLDCEIDKATLEDTILKDYVNQLRNDFETVSRKVSPQIVILTGGASRMPWLVHLAKDVFTKANPQVKVYKDANPSYVVSHGIASYALARAKFEREFEEAEADFWNEYSDDRLLAMVEQYFNDALREVQLPMIKGFMDKWLEGEIRDAAGNQSTQALLPFFNDHNNTVLGDHNEEIQKMVQKRFNEIFQEVIVSKVRELFVECYNGHTPDVPLSLSVDIPFGGYKIDPDYDKKQIESISKKAYADFFTEGRIDKARPIKSDRQKFYDTMMKVQEVAVIRLPKVAVTEARNKLKSRIANYLKEVKKQAPFAIYE